MKLQFIRNGELVELDGVAPTRMLLDLLREDLGLVSCKEGCGEGDCGACSVVLAKPNGNGGLDYQAVNACIRLASSVQGAALWTAQDISSPSGELHPVQEAMMQNHASQCGFCTPGFVMSLFASYQTQVQTGHQLTVDDAKFALSGNLCRCTGYRSIVDAAISLRPSEQWRTDEKKLYAQLLPLQRSQSLEAFLRQKHECPQAQIVAGATDVGLWINKAHCEFDELLDVTQVQELRYIERNSTHLVIGAAVNLTDAFSEMLKDRPQLRSFFHRFAGLPVRNSGTLGGNVANGSPIGDSMPLLIALGASIGLKRWDGAAVQERTIPLESLYLEYKKLALLPDEVLTHINVPLARQDEFSRVYKVSKRFEDDISAVCLAVSVRLNDGVVDHISIGAGGVSATPARASEAERFLLGKVWSFEAVSDAQSVLMQEFKPIDDMRASCAYRQALLGQLLERFWRESQGESQLELADIAVMGGSV